MKVFKEKGKFYKTFLQNDFSQFLNAKNCLKIWKLQKISVSLQKIVRRSAIRKQAFIALTDIIFAKVLI